MPHTDDLRHTLRAQRKSLSSQTVTAASSQVASRCVALPIFSQAQHIAYYLSHENEIDCTQIIHHAHTLKKSLYLPVFSDKNTLSFYLVDENTIFEKNKFGVLEPVTLSAAIDPQSLDLILMPLVAFDAQCHRLGRGAGCYDRALEPVRGKAKPVLIGLAYEFQKVEKIISQAWDVPMDYVVTEAALYSRLLREHY